MQFYANSDNTGNIIGFYNDEIHGDDIPVTCIPISKEQWQDAISKQGKYMIKNGELMISPLPDEAALLLIYKQDKINRLSVTCQTAIISDFTSNALGTIHTYGFDEIDQRNIQGIGINIAIDTTLTSVDWKTRESVTMIAHTRDQMVQVIKDAATHQKSSQYKYLNLKKQVLEASDKVTVDAIVW